MAPGSRKPSGFSSITYSPRAYFAPWFTALPKPTFTALQTKRTCGNSMATTLAEPSFDALSTTMTSTLFWIAAAGIDSRHFPSQSRVLYETMTTLTSILRSGELDIAVDNSPALDCRRINKHKSGRVSLTGHAGTEARAT